ncbi:helix-turn-helix transcriptional regulator [Spirosoma foliorum]|uniref:Helix-turn-helix transcriptional regulator n=1 Tax=Spirosoma foliorum TaxID=2710596 RepID=A0A7G5H1F5_9BACT|nr:AraC family transcriptional regulator [Spirosoma foliorum]QMW04947.1 helix-turn-helix transcriptional regulator [Spirosoma foliorum]
MTNTRNCSVMIKESPAVLSWDEEIYLMHHRHHQEINPTHTIVHMNMISIVINGEKEIVEGNCQMVVPAGSGFFMKKGAYGIAEKVDDRTGAYEEITILFSEAWLRAQAGSIFACTSVVPPDELAQPTAGVALLPADDLMSALTLQLKACITGNADPERKRFLLPAKITELFQILISAPEGHHLERQLRSLDSYISPDLMVLMQNNYKENISLEQYASLANCSLSTFKRKFQQTFKMNPGKWIMQRRLETAYELLQGSEKNITEIAYEVGFETPSHFIASFKQKYRNTPKQVQQRF